MEYKSSVVIIIKYDKHNTNDRNNFKITLAYLTIYFNYLI